MNAKYYVFNPQGNKPTFIHQFEHNARVEAERLAKAYPGQVFQVLHVLGECQKSEVQWRNFGSEYDDIPF